MQLQWRYEGPSEYYEITGDYSECHNLEIESCPDLGEQILYATEITFEKFIEQTRKNLGPVINLFC